MQDTLTQTRWIVKKFTDQKWKIEKKVDLRYSNLSAYIIMIEVVGFIQKTWNNSLTEVNECEKWSTHLKKEELFYVWDNRKLVIFLFFVFFLFTLDNYDIYGTKLIF